MTLKDGGSWVVIPSLRRGNRTMRRIAPYTGDDSTYLVWLYSWTRVFSFNAGAVFSFFGPDL